MSKSFTAPFQGAVSWMIGTQGCGRKPGSAVLFRPYPGLSYMVASRPEKPDSQRDKW